MRHLAKDFFFIQVEAQLDAGVLQMVFARGGKRFIGARVACEGGQGEKQ
jgi:hypothetical protein